MAAACSAVAPAASAVVAVMLRWPILRPRWAWALPYRCRWAAGQRQHLIPRGGLGGVAMREPRIAQQVEHDACAVQARLHQRQAGHAAHLQLKLRHVAAVLAVMAAVVRARGDFIDHQCAVLQHKKLHAQHAHILQAFCYRFGSCQRLLGLG